MQCSRAFLSHFPVVWYFADLSGYQLVFSLAWNKVYTLHFVGHLLSRKIQVWRKFFKDLRNIVSLLPSLSSWLAWREWKRERERQQRDMQHPMASGEMTFQLTDWSVPLTAAPPAHSKSLFNMYKLWAHSEPSVDRMYAFFWRGGE